MTARKLATPTNSDLAANPERLRIVAKSNVEKAFYEADSKERLTACLNTTTIRVLAAMLGELTGKTYDPEDACKEYWVARVAEYFIHIRKVRLHEKFRSHSIAEIQNNPAFAMLQDLVGGKGYTQAYAILCASTAKDLKAMCKAFNLKNISRLNQKKIYARLLVDFADEYWLLYSDFDERKDDSQPEPATAEITTSASDNDNAQASQPADVASTHSETTALNDLPAKFLNADSEPDFDARLALLEKIPLSVLADFAKSELIDTAEISTEKMPAYVRLILNERLRNIARGIEVTDKGIALQTPLLSLYRESRGFLPANIRFRVATQYYGTDKNGVKHVVFIDKRQPDAVCAGLVYDGKSHKVYSSAFDFAVRVRNGVEEITYFKFGCPGATENLEFTVSADSIEPDYDDPDRPGYKPATQSEICYETPYKKEFGVSSEATAQPDLPATAQSETNAQPEPVMEDLATRIVKAKDFKTICTLLRRQSRSVVHKIAADEEIKLPAKSDLRQATAFIAKTLAVRLEKLEHGHDVKFTNMFGIPAVLNSPVIQAFYKSRIPDGQKKLTPLPTSSFSPNWDKTLRNNVRMCVECETADEIRALLNTSPTYDLLARMADECNVKFEYNASRSEVIDAFTDACMRFKATQQKSHAITTAEALPPENLYDDDSFSDAPGDNSHPEQDIPECRENYSVSYNPGLTVIPSEHIERPPYRPIHDTPLDDIPCVNVQPCDSPAAVVPYSQAAGIRNFFRLIAIYLRLWLAMHLTPDNDAIRSHVFAPWFIELADYAPGNPNDTSPFLYKWNRKKFSEKLKLCRAQIATCKDREEIIACLQHASSESIRLFCVADRVLNKFERIYANSECERKLAYAQIYADKIIQRRKKAITVRAEINDITPKIEDKGSLPHDFIHDFARAKFHEDRMRLLETLSLEQLRYLAQSEHISLHGECVEHDCACYILNETEFRFCLLDTGDWPQCKDTPITAAKRKWDEECAIRLATDIEKHKKKISRKPKPAHANDSAHKLINLDGLHETERRNARNHNIALLSACMFPEAVISLLMSATVHTVKSLGLHLGYMCKATKGDKKFLAEKFAAEMFRIRNRKKFPVAQAGQTAKTTALVPDGVKFEVNKKRQICFTFED